MKNTDPGTEQAIANFRLRCAAMREERAVRWGDIELAPEALVQSDEQDSTQQSSMTPEAAAVHARREHRRVAFAGSGGPVKRLDGGTQ